MTATQENDHDVVADQAESNGQWIPV